MTIDTVDIAHICGISRSGNGIEREAGHVNRILRQIQKCQRLMNGLSIRQQQLSTGIVNVASIEIQFAQMNQVITYPFYILINVLLVPK
ncbi:hypothetical protein D3C80_2038270 [compost metagenome]